MYFTPRQRKVAGGIAEATGEATEGEDTGVGSDTGVRYRPTCKADTERERER